MLQTSRIASLVLIVLVGGVLQLLLVFADCKDTPSRAAVEFTKAYFMLDATMGKRLCTEVAEKAEADVVETYLYRIGQEALRLGFAPNYMRHTLYGIETETLARDDNTAEVRIVCTRKRALNPLYAWVARIFFLGQTHTVDETLNLVKEDGRWKVCGTPFDLSA